MSTRRTGFTLFTEKNSLDGDRVKVVLLEKNITCETVIVDPTNPPGDLLEVNPQIILPTLITREIAIYHTDTILEFLDERFPHPPLLPNDPILRAKFRLTIKTIVNDWYPLVEKLIGRKTADNRTNKAIADLLVAYSPLFSETTFFQNEDFSLIDATIAPFLWWVKYLDIPLPKKAQPVLDYYDRLIEKESVKTAFDKKEKTI